MIRPATVHDAAAIAAVHVRCWQAAYRDYLPSEQLDRFSIAERTERWAVWLADPAQPAAVFEDPAGMVGFTSLGPSRDAVAAAATGEVMTLYVEPTHWRRGVGTALLDAALSIARAHGWQRLTLWTLADNSGSRRFYERCGWTPDGAAKRAAFAGQVVAQVRYARSVPR